MRIVFDHVHCRWQRVVCTVFAVGVLTAACPSAADAEPISVEKLLSLQDDWSKFQGTTLQIEGRWSILNESRLLMAKCDDLVFVLDKSVNVPTRKTRNVEVTGKFETRGGKLVFRVTRLRTRLDDLELVGVRRAEIKLNDADGWYRLAEWTRDRAAFYEDDELAAEAVVLYRQGVRAEHRAMPATDVNGLYKLADKVIDLDLPDELREEFLHEAVRRELNAARKRRADQYAGVLTHALEHLPGSDRPLTFDDETLTLREAYQNDPLGAYASAKSPARRVLNRMLYVEAALESIEGAAADDGRNGFDVARRIDETVPEFAELAETYRKREIDYQLGRVSDLRRTELLTLVERLEERDQQARAEEVKRRWLTTRAEDYRERGLRGLLDLAEEYIALLGDEERAADVYREIYQEPGGVELGRERLVELGYEYIDEEWVPGDAEHDDSVADAIRRGIVRRNMTDDQVRAALGGRPESVLRMASRNGVTEFWIYPEHGVAIRFSRRTVEEARIAVDITDLSTMRE